MGLATGFQLMYDSMTTANVIQRIESATAKGTRQIVSRPGALGPLLDDD